MPFRFSSLYQKYPCTHFPLMLIILSDLSMINITGPDSEKYIQSQITTDVTTIDESNHILTAHCNPKGKTLGTFRLFRCNDEFSLLGHRSLRNIQLAAFKKYALFSRVSIQINNSIILMGIVGNQARTTLTNIFNEIPSIHKKVTYNHNTTILWFEYPIERFLLVTTPSTAQYIIKILQKKVLFCDNKQWLALDIASGIPILDEKNSGKFIPQDINMQMLDGISFTKGCYIGQETVARAKFLGANKRVMRYLVGRTFSKIVLAEHHIELQIDNKWKRTGVILAMVQPDDYCLLVQAVINKNIDVNSIFRIHDIDGNQIVLQIKALPYSIA